MIFIINSLVRIACVTNKISIGNPLKSAQNIINIIGGLKSVNPDIILFPNNCLTGGQCAKLLQNHDVIEKYNKSISLILKETCSLDCFIVLDNAVLYKGKSVYPINSNTVLSVGNATISFSSINNFSCNSNIVLINEYLAAYPLSYEDIIKTLQVYSKNCGIAISNGGIGDTSFPYISKGFVGGFESGNKILFKSSLTNECVSVFDIDCDTLPVKNNLYDISFSKECNKKDYLMRQISKTPYLPTEEYKRSAYFKDLFALQSNALARRLKNINISKAVIGISGGLDSTIALLCVKNAFDILDIPSQNIIAVTMQGMGTTKSTFENAIALMEGLNCTIKNIPIKDAVLQHFLDIGHDPDIKDVTYENAQARERTQILFDIANKENAIVVGTGDLSEAMLGFCTFGGDNLSSFNVNGSLLKTVIRMLVHYLSENEFSFIGDILNDILNTPISPELLPADEEGNIAQKTENILGEYILHDFFIYYFVKYNFSKEKLFEYANCAFSNDFSKEYIYEKLNIFFDRFTKSQFKRSCCSEFTRLNDYCTYNLPSDMKNIF